MKTLALAGVLALLPMIGCGGGDANSNNPPQIVRSGIAIYSSTSSAAVGSLDAKGGLASLGVELSDANGIDLNSVTLDVVDASKHSLFGGPKQMHIDTVHSNPNKDVSFGLDVPIPANTTPSTVIYTASITAKNVNGNTINPPVTIATINVPAAK